MIFAFRLQKDWYILKLPSELISKGVIFTIFLWGHAPRPPRGIMFCIFTALWYRVHLSKNILRLCFNHYLSDSWCPDKADKELSTLKQVQLFLVRYCVFINTVTSLYLLSWRSNLIIIWVSRQRIINFKTSKVVF